MEDVPTELVEFFFGEYIPWARQNAEARDETADWCEKKNGRP